MEPAEDEVLPGSDRPPPRRRTRVAMSVLVAAGVVAAGIIALLQRSDGHPDAAPSRSVARSETVTYEQPTAPPSASTVVIDPTSGRAAVDPPCLDVGPSSLNCVSTTAVPVAVDDAVRGALPGSRVVSSYSVLRRSGRLASRTLTTRDGDGRTVRIELGAPTGRKSLITVPSTISPRLIRYETDAGAHHVTITARTPGSVEVPRVAALRRLAADPRLATP